MAQETTLVGLDVGTSKVACVVAKVGMDGKADIVGIGQHAAHGGLQKGVVVNIEATAEAIRQAVQEAEMMGDVQVRSVLVGIAGQHISGMDSHGVVRVKGSEVSEEDVARVIEAAKAVNLPADRRIVHVLEQEYVIDGQGGVREPVGMSGVRLEAQVYLITAAASAVENLMRCCKRCGLYVEDVVLQQLASAEAVLSDEEREMGVAVVDIGEGTTDIIVIARGGVRHVSSLPVGGGHLTNDLMAALRTSRRAAEAIKRRYGAARAALVDDAEVEVPGVGGRSPRTISRQQMVQFLEMRVDE
ncbi:MAG: cell division protein FtsA, partial [Zetaproteobacteria bacterium]